jgi:hypothetical protein
MTCRDQMSADQAIRTGTTNKEAAHQHPESGGTHGVPQTFDGA